MDQNELQKNRTRKCTFALDANTIKQICSEGWQSVLHDRAAAVQRVIQGLRAKMGKVKHKKDNIIEGRWENAVFGCFLCSEKGISNREFLGICSKSNKTMIRETLALSQFNI